MSAVVGIAVTLIVLVVILLFEFRANSGIGSITDKSTCSESVKLNADLRLGGATAGVDLKCPTLFIKVTGSDKNIIFESAAQALADTWNEFLMGREEVFDTKTNDYCVVRRVLEFDTPNTYKGFFDYTLTHNYQDMTEYFNYLTDVSVKEGTTISTDNKELEAADVIDTKTPYAAVFVMSKKANFGKVMGAEYGAVTGGVLGVATAGGLIYSSGGAGVLAAAKTVSVGVAAGTALGTATGLMFGSSYPANWDAGMFLVPYTEENLKALNCNKLPSSVVQTENAAGNK